MITRPDQCKQTIEQLGRMYEVLVGFERRYLDANPQQFALFAEGPIDQIGRLCREIEEYLCTLTESIEAEGEAYAAEQRTG
jgi:hypothetical protein